ncbi:MAG: hypothetical protein K8R02_00110 [Anaerohalosphaeraceae bacterium]|nr:hypothetical protein [Anaerohalosphaeraceae bacterium]
MNFEPDYQNMLSAVNNNRPKRLPIYDHFVNDPVIEKIINKPLESLIDGNDSDVNEYFKRYCNFYLQMTYDTVSYESCITEILPEGGALLGEKAGAIQTRSDFQSYPWDEVPKQFWKKNQGRFEALRNNMPGGMKAIGGIGNGVFEICQDLMGFERLCYVQIDDPELFADIFKKVGDLMINIWSTFLQQYSDIYAVCRFGDDLGFKTGTLLSPVTVIVYIVPQYKRVVHLIHDAGKPFLFHSCGCIFEVMDEIINTVGIDAKHSNEDGIAPFDKWIEQYGSRIGLFGGIDTDHLCRKNPDEIYEFVLEEATRFRQNARGFALGSGNSIPAYVPAENYLAMIRAAQKLREQETQV